MELIWTEIIKDFLFFCVILLISDLIKLIWLKTNRQKSVVKELLNIQNLILIIIVALIIAVVNLFVKRFI